jgi:hypothetical protein
MSQKTAGRLEFRRGPHHCFAIRNSKEDCVTGGLAPVSSVPGPLWQWPSLVVRHPRRRMRRTTSF